MSETGMVKFDFEGHGVRTVQKDGEPWFVAKDVCECLDIGTEQIRRLDDDEKGLLSTQTPGGVQEVSIVNESGLYNLILGSRKPEAKRFKKWVTSEVLPSIRKHGIYGTPQAILDYMTNPRKLAEVFIQLADATEARIAAEGVASRLQLTTTAQERTIGVLAPKALFADTVLNSHSLLTLELVAKDAGMRSAIALNKWLVERDIIFKRGGIYHPTAKYAESKYFDYASHTHKNDAGEDVTKTYLKVTQTGRKFILTERMKDGSQSSMLFPPVAPQPVGKQEAGQ